MTDRIGKYELKRLLATGGMAEIWIAEQSGPAGFQKEIAIKRILPHLARDERFTKMFLDEASIASRLTHPNIAQIFELGEVNGEYFIAMEFVEGLDLAQILDLCEPTDIFIPIDIATRIVADVLSALDFAHEYREGSRRLNVVHRDISPHNVLVSSSGMTKLVDFGVAKAVERHSKTQSGVVKGKLSYMAPEQIQQEEVDRRADIFAVGVLFYELLTNNPPFGRELTAVSGILNEEPADPRDVRPEIPQELVDAIMHALEKDANDRYATAHEMMKDLEAFLRSSDILVSPREVSQWMMDIQGLDAPVSEVMEDEIPSGIEDFDEADTLTSEPSPFQHKFDEQHPPTITAERMRVDSSADVLPKRSFSVAAPIIAFLVVALIASAWAFRNQLGLTSEPEFNEALAGETTDDDQVYDDEDAGEFFAEGDELEDEDEDGGDDADAGAEFEFVEEYDFTDAELASAIGLVTTYEPTDLLVWEFVSRTGLDKDERRYDPGDPEVLAVLDGLGKPAPKKKVTKKKKKKKTKKRKPKKSKKRSTKKPPAKKKTPKKRKRDEFRRIDKAVPSF